MPSAQRIACTMNQPLLDLGLAYELRVPPTEFCVFVVGENDTEKGIFLFDDKAAEMVMDAWAKRAIDLPIDYEHQSQATPPVEAPNAATRWVPQIRNGELWATDVKWTGRAESYLRSGEYRYFSPAFEYDRETRRIETVINLALTNNPAMRGLRPLVAATNNQKEPVMEEELKRLRAEVADLRSEIGKRDTKIAELTAAAAPDKDDEVVVATLSLPAGAPARARAQAVQEVVSFRNGVRGITGGTSDHAALGILSAWKDSHDKVATLSAQLEKVQDEKVAAEFEALLDQAGGKDAKLAPAKRDEIKKVAMGSRGKITAESLETARAFLSMMGPVVSTAGTAPAQTQAQGTEMHPVHAHIRHVLGRQPAAASAADQK